MNATHPRRAKRRHGHLPGHIRDAFLHAVEVYEETNQGEKPPRVPFQVEYRDRTISVAEACRLVWHCTDIMPGMEFSRLCDILTEPPQRSTYAAASHALLAELKARDEVDAGSDAKLSRLYDQRDAMWDRLEGSIAAERGYDLTNHLGRGQASVAASKAMEKWEELDGPQTPKNGIEDHVKRLYEHSELIAAMEDEQQFGESETAGA